MELKQRFVLHMKNYNEYSALDISYINNCIIVFSAFLYFKILHTRAEIRGLTRNHLIVRASKEAV